MARSTITLTVDSERLRAMEVFLRKENTSVQKKMDEALSALFEQTVPAPVREYLSGIGSIRSKRPEPKPPRSQHDLNKEGKPDEQP